MVSPGYQSGTPAACPLGALPPIRGGDAQIGPTPCICYQGCGYGSCHEPGRDPCVWCLVELRAWSLQNCRESIGDMTADLNIGMPLTASTTGAKGESLVYIFAVDLIVPIVLSEL